MPSVAASTPALPSLVRCTIDVGVDTWEPDALIAWVSGCPGSARLHVKLPSDRAGRYDARLQRTLLSMGCTVTRRMCTATTH